MKTPKNEKEVAEMKEAAKLISKMLSKKGITLEEMGRLADLQRKYDLT